MRLDERLEPELGGGVEQPPRRRVVEVAQQQQRRVGARVARGAQVLLGREEPLREQRQRRRRARRTQVVPRAAEALVDEDRDRGRAGALVRGGERCRIGVGTQVAGRRRAALHLGDRGQPGPAQRVREASHHGDSRENATSSSRRAAARAAVDGLLARARALRARSAACPAAAIAPAAFSDDGVALRARRRRRGSRAPCGRSPRASRRRARRGSHGAIPSSAGSTTRSRTAPSTTSNTRFGPAGESSSMPCAPCTTNARRESSTASASATVRATSARVDAEHAGPRARRVRQRPEHVEDRARAELAPNRRGMPHRRMVRAART